MYQRFSFSTTIWQHKILEVILWLWETNDTDGLRHMIDSKHKLTDCGVKAEKYPD